MKKFQVLLIVVLLAVMVFGVAPGKVTAQKFSAYVTGTQVMNLSPVDAAITITYYRADDGSGTAGQKADEVSDTILGNSSKTYFPATSPFNGSVVISSGQPLGAVVNVQNSTLTAGAAYVGASEGATTINLPLLMKNNGGVPYDTWFSVQNTDSSLNANITIDYSDCPGTTDVTAVIKPNASKSFFQAAETCHTGKVFSGKITSDKPLVVVVVEENVAKILAYTGFPVASAAADIVMPLINTNNSGIITGIQIQNTSATNTDVTVSYTPSLAGTACTETQTILGNGSKTFALLAFASTNTGTTTTCIAGEKFIGSAKVTTANPSVPLVAIVNQTKSAYGGAYGAFNPANATPKVVMPLLMDRNGKSVYSTGFSVMNVGIASVYVKCTLTGAAAAAYTPSGLLEPGKALTPNQSGQIGTGYVGSGTCIAYSDAGFTVPAASAKIVAVVNELGLTTADRLLVYEGINVSLQP